MRYLIDLFTKPQIEYTIIDEVVICSLFVIGCVVLVGVITGVVFVVKKIIKGGKRNEKK